MKMQILILVILILAIAVVWTAIYFVNNAIANIELLEALLSSVPV